MGRARYGSIKVKEVKVLGQKININVDSDGVFSASVNGDYLKADTLAGLLPKLRRSAQKARVTVAVTATMVGIAKYTSGNHYERKYLGVGCLDIILTGFDPRTNEVQYRNGDGTPFEKEKFGRFSTREIKRRMTAKEQTEWVRLHDEKEQARKAFDEYEKQFEFDASKTVKNAISAAVDDPKEDADEESVDPR